MEQLEINPGDIVDCGSFGTYVYVCWIENDLFWGTNELEEYEKGQEAKGWYYTISSVIEIVGHVEE